jgi:hypothetical protein
MQKTEWSVGQNQVFVVYVSDDTGNELDPTAFYANIATDAQQYAQRGMRIAAMASVPLRHAQGYIAREGSGYETKMSVSVVYAGT